MFLKMYKDMGMVL